MMMICSQVKREMDASPPSAKYVRSCVSCMLNTQLITTITGFSCGSQQGTKGRLKSQECLWLLLFCHLDIDEVSFRKKKGISG